MEELDTEEFEYTKFMKELVKKEKIDIPTPIQKDRSSGGNKLAKLRAARKFKWHIRVLLQGDKDDVALAKKMLLERKYIAALEKRRLVLDIERVLGCDASGTFTLAEIGQVLGLTRERVRQLEQSALKVLNHPTTGQMLRNYTYD